MAPDIDEKFQQSLRLGKLFTPATPIDSIDLFSGRAAQIRSVVDAINQAGQHVVMYGERGVGKTSLAKMLFPSLRTIGEAPVLTPHIFCDSGDDFSSIWRKVFQEITVVVNRAGIGFSSNVTHELETLSDRIEEPITPDVVRRVLLDVGQTTLLVVILDEFDNISDQAVRRLTADTVKLLSDRAVPATIVMIGVADDVDGLIEQHQSIERCLIQIRMPRMGRDELEEIVTKGLSKVTMTIATEALQEISGISKGLPHYTHLLALHAGRNAIQDDRMEVEKRHVEMATQAAIENTQQSIRNAHHKAILSTKKNAKYEKVLLACAMAETDEWGYFSPTDVCSPISIVMKKPYMLEYFARHLHMLCEPDRGPVLKKMGVQHRFKFRFFNALMQPYVLMRGLADGTISRSDLHFERYRDEDQRMLFKR